MSSSPGGTVPAIRRESNCGRDKPLVSQTTCFAGPPTLRRAMTRTIFIARNQKNAHHKGTENTEVAQRRNENMNALELADPSDIGANLAGTRQFQLVGASFRHQV